MQTEMLQTIDCRNGEASQANTEGQRGGTIRVIKQRGPGSDIVQ